MERKEFFQLVKSISHPTVRLVATGEGEGKAKVDYFLPCKDVTLPSDHPGQEGFQVTSDTYVIYGGMSVEDVHKSLIAPILLLTIHEAMEGYMLEGQRLFNPHQFRGPAAISEAVCLLMNRISYTGEEKVD